MAWALANWRLFAIGGTALAIVGLLLWASHLSSELDTTRVELSAVSNENKGLKNDAAAKERASIERAADTQIIATAEKERTDAIDRAAPGATGDASRKLACLRWARQHPGGALPAGC